MFFQILEKELAGNLDNENIIFKWYRFDGFEPGFEMLPLYDVFDDLQTIGPDFFSIFLHQISKQFISGYL